MREAGFARDARRWRVGGTHRITYHSVAASLITYLHIQYDKEEVYGGVIKRFEITDAEIVYLDVFYDDTEQPHIQPCYRLKGVATTDDGVNTDFAAIVAAVPDEYYD